MTDARSYPRHRLLPGVNSRDGLNFLVRISASQARVFSRTETNRRGAGQLEEYRAANSRWPETHFVSYSGGAVFRAGCPGSNSARPADNSLPVADELFPDPLFATFEPVVTHLAILRTDS